MVVDDHLLALALARVGPDDVLTAILLAQPNELIALFGGQTLAFAVVDFALFDPIAERRAVNAETIGNESLSCRRTSASI